MWVPAETPLRILVVDDNVDTAVSLSWLLESYGYEVRVAHGGRAAVDAAREGLPDAVLLDLGLPDIDGCEAARQIRALPGCAATLLVAATGFNRERDRVRATEAGFDHYLVKPFDPARLDQFLTDHRAAQMPA